MRVLPYLIFRSKDETGRITATRRHTYDPDYIPHANHTASNHEHGQKHPTCSPSVSAGLFDPRAAHQDVLFIRHSRHRIHLRRYARVIVSSLLTISVAVGITREKREEKPRAGRRDFSP